MTCDPDGAGASTVPPFTADHLRMIDERIATSEARLERVKWLVDRQRESGIPTIDAEALAEDVATFIADLRSFRRRIVGS